MKTETKESPSPFQLYVIKRLDTDMYLIKLPHWSEGEWTASIWKAKRFTETQMLEIIKLYPQWEAIKNSMWTSS